MHIMYDSFGAPAIQKPEKLVNDQYVSAYIPFGR